AGREREKGGGACRPPVRDQQGGRRVPSPQAAPPPAGHRPGARSARRPRCPAILSQTNSEWENEPCHSTVGCRTSDPPSHWAGASATRNGFHVQVPGLASASKLLKTVACRPMP